MKVTVKDYLNVRVGKPSVNAPTYQYLSPGSVIDTDGQLYKGDVYEGIDTWIKDDGGNYYWSGGILTTNNKLLGLELIQPFQILIDYNKLLKTTIQIPQNMGKGIGVALLDSGVNINHKDLVGVIVQSQSFISNHNPTTDVWGHGTMMAGFIGGRANSTGVRGVAPACSIYNFKVIDDYGNTDMNALKQALVHIVLINKHSPIIRVVNLSLSVSDLNFINAELNDVINSGAKVIVAGGNNKSFNFGVRLLAKNPHTIGVGVINDSSLITIIPKNLATFYCDQELFSCSSDNSKVYESGKGDSIYTALTTGLIALILAAGGNSLTPYFIDRALFNQKDIAIYN